MGNGDNFTLTAPHLQRLLAAFEQLDGTRILLTGGTGFVGKWILQTAKIAQENSATKIEIVVPTRWLTADHVQTAIAIGCPNVSWIEGDFMNNQLDLGHIDMIIHAATPASAQLNAENPAEMLRINVEAMKSVLRYAGKNQPLLFTSSGAVYGTQPQSVSHIAEGNVEPNPPSEQLNAYAQGKQIAERICREAGSSGQCFPIVARLFAFGGEYLPRDTHFAIGNFIQNALDRQPIAIQGDGRARRSYLYGADMATWLWSALAHSGSENAEPFHIGSEHSVSILKLAQTVAAVSGEVLNYVPEITVAKAIDPSEPIHQYVPANLHTRKTLQVSEWTSLEQCIKEMLSVDSKPMR
jgi:nucleoside-diphosphate-sugar epimerase